MSMKIEDIDGNVVPFARPKPKMQPPGDGPDWLGSLPVGTAFLAREKSSDSFVLGRFFISQRLDTNVFLFHTLDNGGGVYRWVDSPLFSKKMEFKGILQEELSDGEEQ